MEKPKPPEDPAILSTKMPPPAPSPAPAPAAAKKEKKKEGGENSGPMVYDNFKAPSENKSTNNADRHNNDTFNEGKSPRQTSRPNRGVGGNGGDQQGRNRNRQTTRSRNNPNQNRVSNGGEQQQSTGNNYQIGDARGLANRRTRGGQKGSEPQVGSDFDFTATSLTVSNPSSSDDEGSEVVVKEYNKDSFFDDLSNDASDKLAGINNRLRGAKEREVNMEAFGAISLTGNRRRGGGRGRGRGGERRGGRGNGGRGGGRGRGGYRGNYRYRNSDGMPKKQNGGGGGQP